MTLGNCVRELLFLVNDIGKQALQAFEGNFSLFYLFHLLVWAVSMGIC